MAHWSVDLGRDANEKAEELEIIMARPEVATLQIFMGEEEVQTLLDFVRSRAEKKAERYTTDRALVETLLFAGLRVGALVGPRGLTFSSLPAWHKKTCALAVRNGKGGKNRDVPIPPELDKLLYDYAVHVRGATKESDPLTPLFVRRREFDADGNERPRRALPTASVTERIKLIGAQCAQACETEGNPFYGRPGDFRGKNYIWPHRLRHVAATRYYVASGNDVYATQLFLGHSDIETTIRYLETGKDADREIAANVYL